MTGRRFRIDIARVLELSAQGLTQAQIAERLGCSRGGVAFALKQHREAGAVREGEER